MERQINQLKFTLTNMGLNEYQASALSHLIFLGETKATILSKSSGVPNARIYGVLDELSQKGLIIVRPGRPALYAPLTPQEIADALVSASRLEVRKQLNIIEDYRDGFEATALELFKKAGGAEERTGLIRIVSVGEVSLDETRRMYRTAKKSLMISTRAMAYFDQVQDDLKEAVSNGVDIRVIMRKPDSLSPEDAMKQNENIVGLREILGADAKLRYSPEVEIRGVIMDPEFEGRALFLVEEEGIPFFLREAALTNHPGVVKALASMFDLKWQFDAE
jgi:HTH-type transcriptional regulator, sugar sensing transcriptional regulator